MGFLGNASYRMSFLGSRKCRGQKGMIGAWQSIGSRRTDGLGGSKGERGAGECRGAG